jgi:hypothetical protein
VRPRRQRQAIDDASAVANRSVAGDGRAGGEAQRTARAANVAAAVVDQPTLTIVPSPTRNAPGPSSARSNRRPVVRIAPCSFAGVALTRRPPGPSATWVAKRRKPSLTALARLCVATSSCARAARIALALQCNPSMAAAYAGTVSRP